MFEAVKMENYPIGEQDFKQLREAGCAYVDKTMYIHKLLATHSKYFFLGRPRRFGKSLFLSTLRYFFEGKRELFKGLYIESIYPELGIERKQLDEHFNQETNPIQQDWVSYPVLHLDLNCDRYADADSLEILLNNTFCTWENQFDLKESQTNSPSGKIEKQTLSHSQRFMNIIRNVREKTGKEVVILVDEYDKPLVNNLTNEKNFTSFSEKLASIFSVFKSAAENIRFVFVTGVNQFTKFKVFSEINNLRDITLEDSFSDICGFTEEEIIDNFPSGINALALKKEISFEEARKRLKIHYGGYQFTPEGSSLYNPWSLLNSLAESKTGNYGIYTELLTHLVKNFEGIDFNLDQTFHTRCNIDLLDGIDIKSDDPLTLLFYNGYLTIKRYQPDFNSVVLGLPNKEIRQGLFYLLLPHYVDVEHSTAAIIVRNIINSIELGEAKRLVESLGVFLAGASNKKVANQQLNFNNALYILLKLIGTRAKTEFHISDSSVYAIIKSKDFIYIIDLKVDIEATDPTLLNDENNYILPFSEGNRPVFNISATFSHETHQLGQSEIKALFNNL